MSILNSSSGYIAFTIKEKPVLVKVERDDDYIASAEQGVFRRMLARRGFRDGRSQVGRTTLLLNIEEEKKGLAEISPS